MAWLDCAQPASSNIASKLSQNRKICCKSASLCEADLFHAELSTLPLTDVNHMETIA
jgi:hypothetical protein